MRYMPEYFDKQLSSFESMSFGPLDAAVFAQFSMVEAAGTIPEIDDTEPSTKKRPSLLKPALPYAHFSDMLRAELFPTMFEHLVTPGKAKTTLFGVAASPRYRDIHVTNYKSIFDVENHIQFGAVTCIYKKDFAVIAFRGTDASMTGWREDFDMSYMDPVPSQTLALEYLQNVAAQRGIPKKLYVVGHSKGGNLAEYTALKCDPKILKRIQHVYNYDGPGFKHGMFHESDYAPLKGKLTKIIPQGSLIGIMLESYAPLFIAKSDAEGFDQHSTFTWELNESFTDFIYESKLSKSSQNTKKTLDAWISDYTDEQLNELVIAFFDALKVADLKNPVALLKDGGAAVGTIIEALRKLDKPDRARLTAAFRDYLQALSQNTGGRVGFAAGAITNILNHFPQKDDTKS